MTVRHLRTERVVREVQEFSLDIPGSANMSTATTYPHLSTDATGTVRVEGTRYKVQHLASEHHYDGWSADELLRQHPDLRPEQVYAALTYFYDRRDELLAAMEAEARWVEQTRPAPAFARDELLHRLSERTS